MEQAAANEPAALPEFDLVRDRVRILLYLPASCYFASYDIYETFTCMPLKNMVVTCVPLKSCSHLCAIALHFFTLYAIPSTIR
jgi:hypothetical protein